MKRRQPLLINQILRQMIEATGMRPQLERHTIESMWPAVVGQQIASYTNRLYVKDSTLHVYIVSAPLKEELSYARDRLVEKLNEAVGKHVIDAVVIH